MWSLRFSYVGARTSSSADDDVYTQEAVKVLLQEPIGYKAKLLCYISLQKSTSYRGEIAFLIVNLGSRVVPNAMGSHPLSGLCIG